MEWDKDMCEKLIREYKDKEVLWNPRDSAYYNRTKKENAWRELSEKLGKSCEEVRKKIDSLKGSYRREKTRVKKSMGKGKGRNEIYKSKWFAYESLQFLDDKDEARRTLSIVSEDEETDNETLDDSLSEERVLERVQIDEESTYPRPSATEQPTKETQGRSKDFKFPKKRPAKRKKDDEDPRISGAFEYLRQTTATSKLQSDECSLFGDYIAHKLRAFDNRLRAVAQYRISNVLFELEMDLYGQADAQTNAQSLSVHNNFYQHASHVQTNEHFDRLPVSVHHSTSPSHLPCIQRTNGTSATQNSDNPPSASSTPVSCIRSLCPSPRENDSPLSNHFEYFSDSTDETQRTS